MCVSYKICEFLIPVNFCDSFFVFFIKDPFQGRHLKSKETKAENSNSICQFKIFIGVRCLAILMIQHCVEKLFMKF